MRERGEYLDRLLPSAISALATEEFDHLIDRCVLRLKGIDASGVYDPALFIQIGGNGCVRLKAL